MLKTALCTLALLAFNSGSLRAASDHVPPERMQWWTQQKFGMFIHYGPWSHNADRDYKDGQWLGSNRPRQEVIRSFNPVPNAVQQWVDLARDAGMRYVVFTAKHTGGYTFPMWRTRTTDYGITFPDCPYSRQPNPDMVDQIVKATRQAGLGIGLYYPWDDKQHPDGQWFEGHKDGYIPGFVKKYPERWKNFVQFENEQLRELLTQYGPIDLLWFDGGYQDRAGDVLPLLSMIRELQPQTILNSRGTLHMADIRETFESAIPRSGPSGYWETCMGLPGKGGWIPAGQGGGREYMTIGHGWYDYQGPNMEYKDARELVQALCSIASKGGNFLLNIGPRPDGTVPDQEIALLKEIGQWMKVNGDSIYGTSRSPFRTPPAWGRITRKGNTLYLHVFDWPERTGTLTLDIDNDIKSARLLATGEKVGFKRKSTNSVEFTMPYRPGMWEPQMLSVRKAPSDHVSVIVVEVDGDLTQTIHHAVLGKWEYQHAGRTYTREFTRDGVCILKDSGRVGWSKPFQPLDARRVLVDGQYLHVLTEADTLNVENVFTARRISR